MVMIIAARYHKMFGLRRIALGALLLLLAMTAAGARAQIPGGLQPDVQIVVMAHPSGQWAVSAVYPQEVPRATMQKHIERLLALGGWGKVGAIEYETRGLARNDGKRKDRPGTPGPAMSSASFVTGSRLVDWQDATLSVEPFVRAFRDLDRVYVTYFVGGDFAGRFRGMRRYNSDQVEIDLAAQNGAFTYMVLVKDHQLKELGLPRIEAVPAGATVRTASSAQRTRRLVGIGLVVLLAAAAGVFVYAGIHRLSAR